MLPLFVQQTSNGLGDGTVSSTPSQPGHHHRARNLTSGGPSSSHGRLGLAIVGVLRGLKVVSAGG